MIDLAYMVSLLILVFTQLEFIPIFQGKDLISNNMISN